MALQEMMDRIKWLGHDTFCIEGEKRLYFDPYQVVAGPSADLIFVTHAHHDHCSPEDIGKISTAETVIVTEKESAARLSGDVRIVKPGDAITVAGIAIEAVPAYNLDKSFHPKENGWLGFIVTVDGVRIYHAGDTDFIPEMKTFDVDIALLPVSGTYVMTAEEAVEAALAIAPRAAVPMHYGAIVGSDGDAVAFGSALEGRLPVHILPKS